MGLHFIVIILMVAMLLGDGMCANITDDGTTFDKYYEPTWGYGNVINDGLKVQISLDQSTGSGFGSKSHYGSGFFQLKIKLPSRNTAGVVTAFYLISGDGPGNHDELDFEFLGNKQGKPISLQTNVFANDQGGREHRVNLWFDPSASFHTYKILWNVHHIVFFADNIPIRYFKNNKNYGINYPSLGMQIKTSIWDGSSWATDGGKSKIDWNYAPFTATFEGFDVYGCPLSNGASDNVEPCNDGKYWWNRERYWELNPNERKAYEIVKHHYVTYDYCDDRIRYHVSPPECIYQ